MVTWPLCRLILTTKQTQASLSVLARAGSRKQRPVKVAASTVSLFKDS